MMNLIIRCILVRVHCWFMQGKNAQAMCTFRVCNGCSGSSSKSNVRSRDPLQNTRKAVFVHDAPCHISCFN
eukprot:1160493-Pelagomonas_calceolata.AAC.11